MDVIINAPKQWIWEYLYSFVSELRQIVLVQWNAHKNSESQNKREEINDYGLVIFILDYTGAKQEEEKINKFNWKRREA